jgi:hypothetical protein
MSREVYATALSGSIPSFHRNLMQAAQVSLLVYFKFENWQLAYEHSPIYKTSPG